ncbi:unnamed protein product [Lymnaea stagnalis]|uniref:Uncharacterized protein n=1 Tax=Lymnaea stagnalis TaxID=6523 RepID=A0AAV2HDP0_LYMST
MPLQNSVIVLQTSSTAKTLPTKEDVQACIAAEERDRLKKEKQKANDQNRIWSKTSSGGRRKRQQPEKISSSTTSNLLHHQISDKPLDTSDTRIILRSSVTPSPSTGNNQFDRQPQTYNPEGLQDADCRRTSLPLAAYNLSQLCNSNRPSSSEPKIISLEKLSRLDLSTNKKSTVNCCVTGATDVNRSINPESCNESGTRKSEEV